MYARITKSQKPTRKISNIPNFSQTFATASSETGPFGEKEALHSL